MKTNAFDAINAIQHETLERTACEICEALETDALKSPKIYDLLEYFAYRYNDIEIVRQALKEKNQ